MKKGMNIIIFFIIGLIIFFILLAGLITGIIPAYISPNNKHIKGNHGSFDPIAEYDNIKNFAGDDNLKLMNIDIEYVKRDGTIDLNAKYKPTATYTFFEKINNKKDKDMPFGTENIKFKLVTVKISKPYHIESWRIIDGGRNFRFHLGMFKKTAIIDTSFQYKAIEKPGCSLKKLWDNLKIKDIPENSVAVISYTDYGFNFSIKNTHYNYHFDKNGNLK